MLRSGIAAPLTSEDVVVGALVAYSDESAGPALMRAVEEGRHVHLGQLDLAELDRTRAQQRRGRGPCPARPDLAALHLQLVDRDRLVREDRPRPGRDLLLDFAEFTR